MSSAGGLIHGRNTTMVDSETMIKGGDMTLDLSAGLGVASTYDWEVAGACGLIDGRDATLLLWAGHWFSY